MSSSRNVPPSSSKSEGESKEDQKILEFLQEVRAVELKDSCLTSRQQIQRLTRKGSSFFNLNPFDVLLIEGDPETATPDDIKKQYKKLSILCHPDKNGPEEVAEARVAFDILTKAYKCLMDGQSKERILDLIREAKFKANQIFIQQNKKDQKKESFEEISRRETLRVFSERELKRKSLEERSAQEAKRKRQSELKEEEEQRARREFQKNFEESREERKNSWHQFNQKKRKRKGDRSAKRPKEQ